MIELLDWRRRVAACYAEVRRLLATDPQAAHAHWRAVRDQLFTTHPQSPVPAAERASYAGVPCWDYDPALALTGTVDLLDQPERWTTGEGDFLRIGTVRCDLGTLDAFWLDAYGGGLFVPFRDTTAGAETYGGGRYLLDTAKGADLGSAEDGALVLDFNFAYHPSCRYDATWQCPLAPPGNRLDGPVRAGERQDPI